MLLTKGKIENDTLVLKQVDDANGHGKSETVERYPLNEVIDNFPLIQTRGFESDMLFIYRQDMQPPGFEPVSGLDINELKDKLSAKAIEVESLTYGIPHDKVKEWAQARIKGDEKAIKMIEDFRQGARRQAAVNGKSDLVLVNREKIRQIKDEGDYRTIKLSMPTGKQHEIYSSQSQMDLLNLWAYGKPYSPESGNENNKGQKPRQLRLN